MRPKTSKVSVKFTDVRIKIWLADNFLCTLYSHFFIEAHATEIIPKSCQTAYQWWNWFYFVSSRNAQWIIYNGSRTHCFFAEMLTSQNSTFVYESVRRQSNSPKPYKNMARQLLIRSWCHISVFLWWIILDIFIVATEFFSCVAQNNVFDFLMTYQRF